MNGKGRVATTIKWRSDSGKDQSSNLKTLQTCSRCAIIPKCPNARLRASVFRFPAAASWWTVATRAYLLIQNSLADFTSQRQPAGKSRFKLRQAQSYCELFTATVCNHQNGICVVKIRVSLSQALLFKIIEVFNIPFYAYYAKFITSQPPVPVKV